MFKKELDKRERIILPFIKGKSVLDIGPGDTSDRFLHKFISKNSKFVIGLEVDPKRMIRLKNHGYNVILGDAQNFNLHRKFDVIIAGDLIEHLTNFEGFFKSVQKHMRKDSLFIINTPNVFSFYRITGLNKRIPYKEHTCWFCENTLQQLISRFNFRIEKTYFFTHDHGTLKGKIFQWLFKINKRWHSNILFILKLKKN